MWIDNDVPCSCSFSYADDARRRQLREITERIKLLGCFFLSRIYFFRRLLRALYYSCSTQFSLPPPNSTVLTSSERHTATVLGACVWLSVSVSPLLLILQFCFVANYFHSLHEDSCLSSIPFSPHDNKCMLFAVKNDIRCPCRRSQMLVDKLNDKNTAEKRLKMESEERNGKRSTRRKMGGLWGNFLVRSFGESLFLIDMARNVPRTCAKNSFWI